MASVPELPERRAGHLRRTLCRRSAGASAVHLRAAPGRHGCRGPGGLSASGRRGGRRRWRARGSWWPGRHPKSRSLASAAPLALASEQCARTAVPSAIAIFGGSSEAARVAGNACQMPFSLRRLNRLDNVACGLFWAGMVRQRKPSRYRCRMPPIARSSARGSPPSPGSSGSIAAHSASFSQADPPCSNTPESTRLRRNRRNAGQVLIPTPVAFDSRGGFPDAALM